MMGYEKLQGEKTMYTVSQQQLIEEVAKDLAKVMTKPEWADYVKTGVHKERPPTRDDWWFVRGAAILRTVHLKGPVGVSKLRTHFGGLKNRGVAPSHFAKGSGSVARHILQQLESAELIKQAERGAHKGRITTPKGDALLFNAAKRLKASAKPVKAAHEAKPEPAKVAQESKPSVNTKTEEVAE